MDQFASKFSLIWEIILIYTEDNAVPRLGAIGAGIDWPELGSVQLP